MKEKELDPRIVETFNQLNKLEAQIESTLKKRGWTKEGKYLLPPNHEVAQ